MSALGVVCAQDAFLRLKTSSSPLRRQRFERMVNMTAEYMHVGIPVLNKKPNMVYNEWGGFWVNESVDEYDYKIEYLKFEEGTRFPEILSKQPHVAYKVDNLETYMEDADRVIFGPEVLSETDRLAFVVKDDAIIELYESK